MVPAARSESGPYLALDQVGRAVPGEPNRCRKDPREKQLPLGVDTPERLPVCFPVFWWEGLWI